MGLLDNTADGRPVGLLGAGWDDPRSAAIMNLAGGMIQGNLGSGFIGANRAYQDAQDALLKRADLAQNIQLRNIALQQQQQEWALQLPMLKAMAERMNGGGRVAPAAPAEPSAPAIPASPGGALGSGTFGIPMGGQSASAPVAARPTQGGPSMGGSTMFPGVPDEVAFPTAAFGGFKAVLPLVAKFNEPTDLQRNDKYLGITQDQSRATELAKRTKEGYIPPTPLRSPQYITPDGKVHFLPPAPPEGFMTKEDPTDPSGYSYQQVGNGTGAVAATATAHAGGKAAGAAPYDNPVTVPLSDGRSVTLSKPEYAAYQQTGTLPSRYSGVQPSAAPSTAPAAPPQMDGSQSAASTPYERTGSDIAALKREIAAAQRSMDPPAVKQARLDILNRELVKATAAPSGSAPPTQPQAAPNTTPAAPVVGLTPPLGAPQGAVLSQDELSKKGAALMADNSAANTVISRLQNIRQLAPKAIMGAEAERRDFYNGLLSLAGIAPAGDAKSAADLFDKNSAQIVAAMRLGAGGGGTDAFQTLAGAGNPNRHMTPEAAAEAADQLIAQQKMTQTKAQLLQPHYLARDPVAYGKKELAFDQNADPRLWQLQDMTPAQQNTYIRSLPAPVAKDLAAKLKTLPEGAIGSADSLGKMLSSAGAGNLPAAPKLLSQLPTANAGNAGKFAVDHDTGKRFRSNGMQWVEVK